MTYLVNKPDSGRRGKQRPESIDRRVAKASGYQINRAEPGWYQMRHTKGGVQVPVLIWRPCLCTIGGPDEHAWTDSCDRYPGLMALVDGWEDVPPLSIWNHCHPITEAEYTFLVKEHAWAREHDPYSPQANPKRPVDLGRVPSIF